MTRPRITLATAASMPDLYPDEAALPDMLFDQGLEPKIEVWNDPHVDWEKAGMVVVRSVVDYATDRKEFLKWAQNVPRLLNNADALQWNSDKHYLIELERRGLPTIATTWLSADQGYNKQQVHSRFPAHGDFVLKPAVSSGMRDIGRYTANNVPQRQAAMSRVMEMLSQGRDVMIQRYQEVVETQGEMSMIFFNGQLSHSVDKTALLSPDTQTGTEDVLEIDVTAHHPTDQELGWAEKIRKVMHQYVRSRIGRDELFLYNRVDLVPDGEGNFLVMEIALVDGNLYLGSSPDALTNFAEAIAMRAFW